MGVPTDEPTVDNSLPAMGIWKQEPIIKIKNGGKKYVGKLKVWLRDDTNGKVGGVTVSLKATKENGQSKVVTKVTNGGGVANLNLWKVDIDEEIKVEVESITKDGFVYDANLNVEIWVPSILCRLSRNDYCCPIITFFYHKTISRGH